MKKYILKIATLTLTCFGSIAQTNLTATTSATGTQGSEINAPVIVTNKFSTDHPNVIPAWGMDGDDYTAEYRDQTTNLDHIITYDKFSNVLHADNEMDRDSYPATIRDYYAKNHPGQDYTLWRSMDNLGNVTYYTKEKSCPLYFDKNGNCVSNKTKTKKTKNQQKTASR